MAKSLVHSWARVGVLDPNHHKTYDPGIGPTFPLPVGRYRIESEPYFELYEFEQVAPGRGDATTLVKTTTKGIFTVAQPTTYQIRYPKGGRGSTSLFHITPDE